MKIALIGYGKMGKEIEKVALERGHEISHKITIDNIGDTERINASNANAAIEFTQPDAAVTNIKNCLKNEVPIIVGTTGWYNQLHYLKEFTEKQQGALFYASNFSVGVNIFFAMNKFLAKIMNTQTDYSVAMEEIHHTQKLDSPSGTAITLAEGIIGEIEAKKEWINEASEEERTLGIISKREENVPGTHSVTYKSQIDEIEIKHTAFNRKGFALGAVIAAEWLQNKKGIYSMDDMFSFNT